MIRHLLLPAAVLCASACAEAQEDPAAERQAVTELVQRWSDAGEAQDWDTVADTYADVDGFVWIEQGTVRYDSHDAIVAGLNQARDMSATIRNDVSDILVTPLGPDTAAFRTHYLLDVSAEGFGYTSEGMLAGVAIRQEDGRWRFLQGVFSAQPAAEGP